jgi:hypothetical protein
MKRDFRSIFLLVFIVVLTSAAFGQTKAQQRNITVNGQNGKAEVIDQNGRLFVDLLALASIGKGSVSFSGPGIVLTLPATASAPQTGGNVETLTPPVQPANSSALSRGFMLAGIEEVARLREWATTLASAIKGGYGVTDDWVNGYREQASQSQLLADASVSTDGDRSAAQMLHHAFGMVQQWSDNLVAAKKSMDTAKYTTSPNALREDPQSQKLLTCGRFLTQMLGSATFQDDGSCH